MCLCRTTVINSPVNCLNPNTPMSADRYKAFSRYRYKRQNKDNLTDGYIRLGTGNPLTPFEAERICQSN